MSVNEILKECCHHLCHPYSKKNIQLEKWEKTLALSGLLLTPFLIFPGIAAFYGVSYYFKHRKLKSLNAFPNISKTANSILSSKTERSSDSKISKTATSTINLTQKESFQDIHSKKISLLIQQIHINSNPKERLRQFNEIQRIVIEEGIDEEEYLRFLKSKDVDCFFILFKAALLKNDQNILINFLYLTDLKELNEQFKGLADPDSVKLIFGKDHFSLSKRMLASFIPYFAQMFQSGFNESRSPEIHISDVSYKTFKKTLNFLFFNLDIQIDANSISEFIYVAGLLQLPQLKNICRDWLNEHFDQLDPIPIDLFQDSEIAPSKAINAKIQDAISKGKKLSASDKKLLPFVTELVLPSEGNSKILPLLSKLPNLKTLHVTVFSSAELTVLQSLKQIKHLHLKIDPTSYTPSHFDIIETLPLRGLILDNCPVSEQDLKSVAKHNQLQNLSLENCKKLGKGWFSYLSNFVELQSLNVRSCYVRDKDLALLANFKKLHTLNLSNILGIKGSGLAYIADLTKLENLILNNCLLLEGKGLVHLANLKKLQLLDLGSCRIEDQDLIHLANLKRLRILSFGFYKITNQGLIHIAKLTNLENLNLARCRVDDKALAHLVKLKKLQTLDLSSCYIKGFGFRYLAHLKRLRSLNLQKCHELSDNGLASIYLLKKLEYLDLKHCYHITNRGLSFIFLLKNLKYLDISECSEITGQGLKQIDKLEKLHVLKMSGTHIHKGLVYLSNLKMLQTLDVNYCFISDEDLKNIDKCKSLKTLHIKLCTIRNKGFTYLANCKGLKELNIGYYYHRDDVSTNHDRLIAALPKTKVKRGR